MPWLVPIAVFVGVAALIAGIALLFRRGEGRGLEDRLDVLTGLAAAAKDPRQREGSLLAEPLDDRPGALETLASHFGDVRKLVEQADVPLSPGKLLLISGGLGAAAAFVTLMLGVSVFLAPVAFLALAAVPWGFLLFKRKRRMAQFAKQLPDALELVARALRAGHSLAAGFHLVGEEMPAPIGREFTRVYESQNLGLPLEEALEEMTERVPNLDLRFFATAVILQRQTGGDLAEILDKIGRLIRERFKIWGQIQALTGEGRLSGIVLLALPPVLFLVMLRLNYDYVMMLFTDPMGKQMLAVAVGLQILGALVIKKIINIKV